MRRGIDEIPDNLVGIFANYVVFPLCIALLLGTPILVVYNISDFLCSFLY